jgi:hypothetical protein
LRLVDSTGAGAGSVSIVASTDVEKGVDTGALLHVQRLAHAKENAIVLTAQSGIWSVTSAATMAMEDARLMRIAASFMFIDEDDCVVQIWLASGL